jgi:peptidoglycan/xylan/chitin deacetylase (PgdA/CDA1 family)
MRIILLIFILIITFFLLNYLLPHLVKKLWRKRFLKWANDSGKIYLTFDDGPEISTTGQILDLLKVHGIQATFFVLGVNVQQNPYLTQRIIKEGHVIGIHGKNHLHPWKVLPWRGMADLSCGKKILEKNGIKTNYVRPPYGKLNILSLLYILINRLTFIHWNIDPKDYNQSESEMLTERLKSEIQKGKVVLLHDGRRPGTSPGNVTVKGLADFLGNTDISGVVFSPLP